MSDFPTSIRLLEVGSLDVIFDFHDPDAGYEIGAEVTLPLPNKRQGRLKTARARGSFPVGARLPDDGVLAVPVVISGSSWAQQQTRYVAMYAAIESVDVFYVETVLSGVTTRWYCDAPVDVIPEPIDAAARMQNSLEYELRFLVQPNPAVTIGV